MSIISERLMNLKIKLLHETLQKNKRNTLVIGISGGIDSAVTLAILKQLCDTHPNTYQIIPMLCPIYNSTGTTEQKEAWVLGYELLDHFNLSENTYALSKLSEAARDELNLDTPYLRQQIDYWLRPMAFYRMAMEWDKSIMVSTTNNDEWELGWFSQYLDIFGIHPIIEFNKSDIYDLAEFYNIPKSIINTPPKGGLASGKTDEEALGFSYEDFKDYRVDPDSMDIGKYHKIKARIEESEFKRYRFNKEFIFECSVIYKGTY